MADKQTQAWQQLSNGKVVGGKAKNAKGYKCVKCNETKSKPEFSKLTRYGSLDKNPFSIMCTSCYWNDLYYNSDPAIDVSSYISSAELRLRYRIKEIPPAYSEHIAEQIAPFESFVNHLSEVAQLENRADIEAKL